MKRFDLLYYHFIFGSMALSVIMAPVMFIQQNVLAGWLWIGAFVLLMLFLLCDATKDTAIARTQYETWLGAIIAWVCIVGQWIIIFINPMRALLYTIGLMFMALGSLYFGWWAEHHRGRTEAQKHQKIMMGLANKYGKDEARSNPSVYDAYSGADIEEPPHTKGGEYVSTIIQAKTGAEIEATKTLLETQLVMAECSLEATQEAILMLRRQIRQLNREKEASMVVHV